MRVSACAVLWVYMFTLMEAKPSPPAQEAFLGQRVSNDDISTSNRPLALYGWYTGTALDLLLECVSQLCQLNQICHAPWILY